MSVDRIHIHVRDDDVLIHLVCRKVEYRLHYIYSWAYTYTMLNPYNYTMQGLLLLWHYQINKRNNSTSRSDSNIAMLLNSCGNAVLGSNSDALPETVLSGVRFVILNDGSRKFMSGNYSINLTDKI